MNPTLKQALRSGEIRTDGPRTKEYKELSPQLEKTIEEQRLMLEEALGFDLGIHEILSTYYNAELKAVLKYNKKFNEKLNLRTVGEVLEEMQKIITLFKSKKIKLNVKDLTRIVLYFDYEYLKNLFEELKELDEGIIKRAVRYNKSPEAKLREFIEKIEELKNSEEFKDLDEWIIKKAVVGNKMEKVEGILREWKEKIEELKNSEEFKDLGEGIIKEAVVKNKTPEAKLREFIEKIEELKNNEEFKDLGEGIIKKAVVGNKMEKVEGILREWKEKIKEIKNSEEFKDLDIGIIKKAVVGNKMEKVEAKLREIIEKIEELKNSEEFKDLGEGIIKKAVVGNKMEKVEGILREWKEKIMPAIFMKGQTFEELVGVYLRMKYPNDNIVRQPYMCEVVDENGEIQYSDKADFYIPSENLIVEVKWGQDTFGINKHYKRQQGLLKKGQKYEGICVVENHGLPKEFVSFEKVLRENLNKSKSDTFVVLLTLIEKLAKENDAKTLKAMRNAIFTCFDIEDLEESFNQLEILSYVVNYRDLEGTKAWLTERGFDTNPEQFGGNIIVISNSDNDFDVFDDCDDFDYEEI